MAIPEFVSVTTLADVPLPYECVGRGESSCPSRPEFQIGVDILACGRHVGVVMADRLEVGEPTLVVRFPQERIITATHEMMAAKA